MAWGFLGKRGGSWGVLSLQFLRLLKNMRKFGCSFSNASCSSEKTCGKRAGGRGKGEKTERRGRGGEERRLPVTPPTAAPFLHNSTHTARDNVGGRKKLRKSPFLRVRALSARTSGDRKEQSKGEFRHFSLFLSSLCPSFSLSFPFLRPVLALLFFLPRISKSVLFRKNRCPRLI
jgi:hypothetical protein